MDPIMWRTISQIAVFVGSGLALVGGVGTYYFGNVVENIMPFRKPIHSASVTVEITVDSEEKRNNHYMDSGGVLILGKGTLEADDALLMLSSQDSWASQLGGGRVRYRGIFNMDVEDNASGKPVNHLTKAEYAVISFKMLPKEEKILGGKAVFTINSDVRFDINIPEQKQLDGMIIVKDLSEAFSNFKQ